VFGAHNLGRRHKERKKRKKEKARFLYVGIVDKKTIKMELEIPAPPSLTTTL
jgi:hypothetical protein